MIIGVCVRICTQGWACGLGAMTDQYVFAPPERQIWVGDVPAGFSETDVSNVVHEHGLFPYKILHRDNRSQALP